MTRLIALVLALWPCLAQAQVDIAPLMRAFELQPLPPDEVGPITLSYGSPETMRALLAGGVPSETAFTAMARTVPQAMAAASAQLLRQGSDRYGFDFASISMLSTLQAAGATSMVLALPPGQADAVGPALEAEFGYERTEDGVWSRSPGGAPDLFRAFSPSAYVTFEGEILVQASDPAMLASADGAALPPDAFDLIDMLPDAVPDDAQLLRANFYLNLPVAAGFPLPAMLIADLIHAGQDMVLVAGLAQDDAAAAQFQAALVHVLGDDVPISVSEDRTIFAAYQTEVPSPDVPPWRNTLVERVTAMLQDGSFWDSGG